MTTADRRTAILDTFETLVERYGVEKVSVHDVAARAGISVGTLYNEFGSKAHLVASAADRVRDGVIARVERSARAPFARDHSAEDELRALIRGWIRALMDLSLSKRFLIFRSVAPKGTSVRPGKRFVAGREVFRARLAARIAPVLARGVGEGTFDVPNVSSTAARFVDAFMEYWPPPGAMDRAPADVLAHVDEMLDLLLRGVRTR